MASTRRNASRKNRKLSRKNRKSSRKQTGGQAVTLEPALLSYSLAGSGASQSNLAQGKQYDSYHANQHGGQAAFPSGVTNSILPADMHLSARVVPLDNDIEAIKGLRDPGQMGGRRSRSARLARRLSRRGSRVARRVTRRLSRRVARKFRRSMRKVARKSRRSMRKTGRKAGRSMRKTGRKAGRNMSGGQFLHPASADAPGMLLDAASEARAVRGMNTVEWKLAADPTSFNPKA